MKRIVAKINAILDLEVAARFLVNINGFRQAMERACLLEDYDCGNGYFHFSFEEANEGKVIELLEKQVHLGVSLKDYSTVQKY